MPTPLQITAGGARRARRAFNVEDAGGRVFNPGEHGYHGPRETKGSKRDWDDAASRANFDDPHNERNNPNKPGVRTAGAITAAAGGVPVLGAAAIVPWARSNWRKREQEARARQARLSKQWMGDAAPFHPEDPGIRHATEHGGAHRVHSMKPKLNQDPLSRIGRAALKHDHLVGTVYGAGALTGIGILAAGIHGPKKRAEQAQRDLRNARRRQTLAQRKVAKAAPSMLRQHFGSPKLAAATLKRNPQLLAFGGVGGATAASGPVTHNAREDTRRKRDTTARGVYGAIAGQSAYQGATYGSNYIANRQHNTIYKDPNTKRGYARTRDKKIMEAHKKKYGLTNPNVPTDLKGFYRNMPDEIRGGRHLKINAHLTTGRRGVALGTAFTAAGAMAGMHSGHGRKQEVHKALYERTSRPSLLRSTEAVAGGALLAWGAGRSKMIGSALGHGVKMAESRGSARAVEALRQAQAAQGALRRGTAPAERTIRQIQAVDRAVRAVPAPLRGDIATAAGILLVGNAQPIRRNTYRPISAPSVPYRTVGW